MKRFPLIFLILLSTGRLTCWTPSSIAAQQKETPKPESAVTQPETPEAITTPPPEATRVMREFRGIKLGMNRDEVRDTLGKPEISETGKDRFKIGGEDRLTAHYENESVKVIQLYFFKSNKTP